LHDLIAQQEASIFVIRFLSERLMDPHLYFQVKYIGLVQSGESVAEVQLIMRDLMNWVHSGGLDAADIQALDQALAQAGLPTFVTLVGDN